MLLRYVYRKHKNVKSTNKVRIAFLHLNNNNGFNIFPHLYLHIFENFGRTFQAIKIRINYEWHIVQIRFLKKNKPVVLLSFWLDLHFCVLFHFADAFRTNFSKIRTRKVTSGKYLKKSQLVAANFNILLVLLYYYNKLNIFCGIWIKRFAKALLQPRISSTFLNH